MKYTNIFLFYTNQVDTNYNISLNVYVKFCTETTVLSQNIQYSIYN